MQGKAAKNSIGPTIKPKNELNLELELDCDLFDEPPLFGLGLGEDFDFETWLSSTIAGVYNLSSDG